jgi:hypothetical protein
LVELSNLGSHELALAFPMVLPPAVHRDAEESVAVRALAALEMVVGVAERFPPPAMDAD